MTSYFPIALRIIIGCASMALAIWIAIRNSRMKKSLDKYLLSIGFILIAFAFWFMSIGRYFGHANTIHYFVLYYKFSIVLGATGVFILVACNLYFSRKIMGIVQKLLLIILLVIYICIICWALPIINKIGSL